MSSYEFPFNERVRTLLRLEDLFKKVLSHIDALSANSHHAAMVLLLQMLDMIERADIKADIINELDRQRATMQSMLGNPNISEEILSKTIRELEENAANLRQDNHKIGHYLRESEWLMTIKQRAIIPGGLCQFDQPSYHHWLSLSSEARQSHFNGWIKPLLPMFESIKCILHILRGSGETKKYTANSGFYQQMLGGSKPAQMVKILVLDNDHCFPEVSANKYAINVRFNELDFVDKPTQYDHEVNFEMTLCNLL